MSGFLHNLARRTEPVMDLRPRLLSRFEADQGSAEQESEQPSLIGEHASAPVTPQLSFDQQETLLQPKQEPQSPAAVQSVTNVYQHVNHQQTFEQPSTEPTTTVVQQPNDEIDAKLATFEHRIASLNNPTTVPPLSAEPSTPINPGAGLSDKEPTTTVVQQPNNEIDAKLAIFEHRIASLNNPTTVPELTVNPESPAPAVPVLESPREKLIGEAAEGKQDEQHRRMNRLERQWSTLRNATGKEDTPSKLQAETPSAPHVTNIHKTQNLVQPERVIESGLASATSVPEVRAPEPAPVSEPLTSDSLPDTRRPRTPNVAKEDDGQRTKKTDVRPTSHEPQKKVTGQQVPQADTYGIAQQLLRRLNRTVSSSSEDGKKSAVTNRTPVQSLQPEKTPAVRAAMTPQKTINVSIGRVEVRAASSAKTAVPAPAAASVPASKVMSLDEYIARRSSGGMA